MKPEEIISDVCNAYQITKDELRSKCRRAELCDARSVVCYILRKHGLSSTEVGRLINRDHTSVLYHAARAEVWQELPKQCIQGISTIKAILNNKDMDIIKIRLIEVAGLASALQALHLPYGKDCKSGARSSAYELKKQGKVVTYFTESHITISPQDEALIKRLIEAGDEHAKVMRGIVAYLDITAPRFWWQEMDTYRVGREQLASESTMHIQCKNMTEEQMLYIKSHLQEGTMQRRIIMLSYQTLRRIIKQRSSHRLPHWRLFCEWTYNNLPYNWML